MKARIHPALWGVSISSILTICTGGGFRSRIMAVLLGQRTGLRTAYAGTTADWQGRVNPHATAVLEHAGIYDRPLISHQVRAGEIAAAGIVVCAERRHREQLCEMYPEAAEKMFTLAELAGPRQGQSGAGVEDVADPTPIAHLGRRLTLDELLPTFHEIRAAVERIAL